MKLLLSIAVFMLTSYGVAQTKLTPDTALKSANADQKKEGWIPNLKLGANLQFTSNERVIGQVDGQSMTFGANLNGGLGYFMGQHEWSQSLSVVGAYSKTPTIENYLKTSDELKYDSLYLYMLEDTPWLGPYFRVQAATAIFFGEDVQASSVTYIDPIGANSTGASLRLTDGFSPLTLKESVGAFAKLIDRKDQKLDARIGFGALQLMNADGQKVIEGKDASGNINVGTLADYEEAGLELGLVYKGSIDSKTSYLVSIESLIPFINNDAKDRAALDLTSMDFLGSINSKLYDWMSVTYELKIKKQPQLLDAFQIQSMFLLNFNYSVL